jgi:NAD(P)-dependent dehydrogenase (short-subunit alcohol dehydrogenase family)
MTASLLNPASFDGKVAIVTGAGRGIGAAVARAFADVGTSVVLAARNEDDLGRLARELDANGADVLTVPTNVADEQSVANLVEKTVNKFGRLDIACNNAGGSGRGPTPLAETDVSDFDATVAVGLRGVFLGLKYEIPAMLASGGGAIVNMSSTAGSHAVGGLAGYVSAKHGVEGLTRVAALDYADRHIRVNAVAPGPILTGSLERAGADVQRRAAAAMPVKRVGRPDEVAAAVLWLCSDATAFATGTTFVLDGGMLAGTPPFSQRQSAQ